MTWTLALTHFLALAIGASAGFAVHGYFASIPEDDEP